MGHDDGVGASTPRHGAAWHYDRHQHIRIRLNGTWSGLAPAARSPPHRDQLACRDVVFSGGPLDRIASSVALTELATSVARLPTSRKNCMAKSQRRRHNAIASPSALRSVSLQCVFEIPASCAVIAVVAQRVGPTSSSSRRPIPGGHRRAG
jgi:hypothetical protein